MNLKCQEARPLLDSYVMNELQVETLHAVNTHLAECPACRVALASRERTRAAVNAAVRNLTPGDDFAAQVRNAVRAEASRSSTRSPWLALALAAAVLLVAAVGWPQWQTGKTQILARLGLAKGDHVFCARGGFFPDDPPTAAAMREQVGPSYARLVNDVERQAKGYVIRDGHVCHWQEREFVHFILEKQNRLISLVVTRKQRPDEVFPQHALLAAMRADGLPVYTTEDNGMAIAGLETGQHLAFTVSERGPAEGLSLLAALAPAFVTDLPR